MKKPPQTAISLELGRMSQGDFDRINQEVKESVEKRLRHAEREAKHSADASPPATNRGGKSEIGARLVLEDGKVLEIPARRTWGGDSAFLDWVNFTTHEEDFMKGLTLVSDQEFIAQVSYQCQLIYGFGITSKRDTGANFYHESYVLGDGYGMVCHGGQRNTVLVMLSGQGCEAAKEGWEKRLYDFLNICSARARLTRVDLAHDDYEGSRYTVDQADQDFDASLFNCGGRNPNHEQRGNWRRPNGKGRTLYIGNRENGKFARVYEKGKQLGDKESPWVRIEVEMKSVNRIIPFEVLLHPGQYLAASYPAFNWISERQERILTTQKTLEITYAAAVEFAQKQVGALINVMVNIEDSVETVISKLIRDAIPKRLKLPGWQYVGECLHDLKTEPLTDSQLDATIYAM